MANEKHPGKWWKSPPELAPVVEKNRAEFKAQFGSFEDVEFVSYWLGTSEDGKYLAFQFHRPDGSIHRFALPGHRVELFFTDLAASIDEMGERQLAQLNVKGSA
ncbi:hypothetical protein [Mesorhizobium argentiipisi]|uniref:DUF3601 domain-containing protein n=1 Tax=Mesorhizobium argentiipisi TaxID=3015175 RepID=A0ABU8KD15_9HYPH